MRSIGSRKVVDSEFQAAPGDCRPASLRCAVTNRGVPLLAAFAMAMLCLGCGGQSPQKPVTITFLDLEWDIHDRLPGLSQDLEDFTRDTGIRVKRLPGPDGSLNQLALWRELLRKGTATPDVCNIDVNWSGVLNPYLTDLKPHFADEIATQDPAVVASYTFGNRLLAVPHHAYLGVLFYRVDLLQRYGYREPPGTWDELEAVAAGIQARERARGQKDFWGYVWQGAADEDLTCNALEWQMSEGGGRIIEEDGTITVNNPQAVRSWQRGARWAGRISPSGVAAYSKWDAENLWAAGKAAFLRSWASEYSLTHVHTPPTNATRFGVTSVPGGSRLRVSTLGGNGLAVPTGSAHPREAMEMIRYLRRKDTQRRMARRAYDAPRELEFFELPTVLNPYPELARSWRQRGGVVARPSIVAGQKYEEVSRAFIREVHAVLTGAKEAAAAAVSLEKELAQITRLRTAPPLKR
ncbi:MAG TPA: extracellular solute-binding protein [Bryobacteraceae bacterium]|nr:extracellular solute-binding protein [Bryobacteraceae bacterium]